MNRVMKLEKSKESESYAVFANLETVPGKNAKGNDVEKQIIASKTVYVHKSVAEDEPAYYLVPARLFEAMQAQMPKGDAPATPKASKKR